MSPRPQSAPFTPETARKRPASPRTLGTARSSGGWRSPIPRQPVAQSRRVHRGSAGKSTRSPAQMAPRTRLSPHQGALRGFARTGWRCASHMNGATIPAIGSAVTGTKLGVPTPRADAPAHREHQRSADRRDRPQVHWPLGRRPDRSFPGLSELGPEARASSGFPRKRE